MRNIHSYFFLIDSLVLGQSFDCTSAGRVTPEDMGEINQYISPKNPQKCTLILGMYGVYKHLSTCNLTQTSNVYQRVCTPYKLRKWSRFKPFYIYSLPNWSRINHSQGRVVLQLQSSADITDITLSIITRYCIDYCRNLGKISIRDWIHNRHPIPRPNGRAMGCLLWILFFL